MTDHALSAMDGWRVDARRTRETYVQPHDDHAVLAQFEARPDVAEIRLVAEALVEAIQKEHPSYTALVRGDTDAITCFFVSDHGPPPLVTADRRDRCYRVDVGTARESVLVNVGAFFYALGEDTRGHYRHYFYFCLARAFGEEKTRLCFTVGKVAPRDRSPIGWPTVRWGEPEPDPRAFRDAAYRLAISVAGPCDRPSPTYRAQAIEKIRAFGAPSEQ